MKRKFFLSAFIIPGMLLFGQVPDTVTLDYCYKQAEKNFPLAKQIGLLGKSNELKIKNLNKNWLPYMNLNGSASYQSDVPRLTVPVLGGTFEINSPEISLDWYKLTLDVRQAIYDGNVTSYQKNLEIYNLKSDQLGVQIELYKIKDRINLIYFSIILSDENETVLNATKKALVSKQKEVESAVKNGAILATSNDAILVELLRIDQELGNLHHDRAAAVRMLSELISVDIPENSAFVLPDVRLPALSFENKRLEYQLYDVQQEKTGLLKNMVTTNWNPKLYAFGQGGYGRPGLNMLSNDFTPWYIVGATLSWNFFNWNQNRNQKKIYDLQNDIIRSQKETFDKNLRVEADRGVEEILKLTDQLKQDQEIMDLREKITKTSSSQLNNGTITSSEYISRLNEEIQAKLTLELHRIQLVKAKLNYLFTLGKL